MECIYIAVQEFLDYYILHGKADQLTSTVEALSSEPPKKKRKKGGKSIAQAEKETMVKNQNKSGDGIFNYACRILGMNLMARNFHDASRQGDGERLIRC